MIDLSEAAGGLSRRLSASRSLSELFRSSLSNSVSGSIALPEAAGGLGIGASAGGLLSGWAGKEISLGGTVAVLAAVLAAVWPGTSEPGPMPSPSRAALSENSGLIRLEGLVAAAGVIGPESTSSGWDDEFQGIGRDGRSAAGAGINSRAVLEAVSGLGAAVDVDGAGDWPKAEGTNGTSGRVAAVEASWISL
jgi:hypothetical protein